jgi:hypothetical protein
MHKYTASHRLLYARRKSVVPFRWSAGWITDPFRMQRLKEKSQIPSSDSKPERPESRQARSLYVCYRSFAGRGINVMLMRVLTA